MRTCSGETVPGDRNRAFDANLAVACFQTVASALV